MKPYRRTGAAAAAALTLGLLLLWIPASSGQPPDAKPAAPWEYKTFFGLNRQTNDEELNRLGQEGWELVAVGDDPRGLVRYVFKRLKRK